MAETILTTLIFMTMGQVLLAVPLLLAKKQSRAESIPLAVFLLASGVLAINSLVQQLLPDWYWLYTALVFPALFILCPSLLLYVKTITSKQTVIINKEISRHLPLVALAVLLSIIIGSLPIESHNAIFVDDAPVSEPLAIATVIGLSIMMLLWLLQCSYTIFRITSSLNSYRTVLKDELSNCDNKSLYWINWLMFIAITGWLLTLLAAFTSSLFNNLLFSVEIEAFITLLLVWFIAFFGLRQESAFVKDKPHLSTTATQEQKYQRSALTQQDIARISEKINTVMQREKLYLDSELSLQKLSRHTKISANYISQALNQGLQMNFFDFVNHWRIKEAKQQIIANDDTVLNIAFATGFNARSSFYKAFKKEIGMTPSAFRKQQLTS